MKSVIQEASSLSKAIEQGWNKAGKPKEFSVKVFEEPVKNLFGFTSKPAKIGIFVHDRPQQERHKPKGHAPQRRRHHRQDQWRRPHDKRQQQGQQQRRDDHRSHEPRSTSDNNSNNSNNSHE